MADKHISPQALRHPERVSVSIDQHNKSQPAGTWLLKRVQHDGWSGEIE